MKITQLALKFDKTVYVAVLLVLVLGFFAYLKMPRERFPGVNMPYFLITASYPGTSPDGMESLVTIPIEREIATVSGVVQMTSTSWEGAASVFVRFETDVDTNKANSDLKDALDRADSSLPADMKSSPRMSEVSFHDRPVMILSLGGGQSDFQLDQITEDLRDTLEALPSVLKVEVHGVREQEIQLEIDPDQLTAYQLSLDTVVQTVRDQNNTRSGKVFDLGKGRYSITVPNPFQDMSDIYSTVVATRNGSPIYLRDIAQLRIGFKEKLSLSRVNGEKAATMDVKMRTGGNMVKLSDAVQKVVAETQRRYPSLDLIITRDISTVVRSMVADLEGTVLLGFFVLLLVIFFFLGFVNSFFIATVIPLSAAASILIIQAIGYTLNQMVLVALLVSLGMLVDNGIVIVESIYRLRQHGASRLEAVHGALREVGWPVVSSTATTLAAFAPLAFWSGVFGAFFRPFVVTFFSTMSCSLLVALTVNPVLCANFMTLRPSHRDSEGWALAQRYRKLVAKLLSVSWWVVLAVLLYFILSFFAFGAWGKGRRLSPSTAPDSIRVTLSPPEGLNLATVDSYLRPVERYVEEHYRQQYKSQVATVTTRQGTLLINLKSGEEMTTGYQDMVQDLRRTFGDQAGYQLEVRVGRQGPPSSGAAINLEISSENPDELRDLVQKSKALLADIAGTADIADNLVMNIPKVEVRVDPLRAALNNVSFQTVALVVSAATQGYTVDSYLVDNKEFDITLRYPQGTVSEINRLANIIVPGRSGEQVPLSSVATISLRPSSGAISRKDQARVATVTADNQGRNINEIATEFMRRQEQYGIPYSQTSLTGVLQDQRRVSGFMNRALLIALALMWMVLLAQFNSFRYSVLVLLTAALPVAGVFWGLALLGKAFYLTISGMAVITLAGVAVNNSIVMISHINDLRRKRKLPLREAIVQGSGDRFRPIVLTSLTTIIGMLPLAIGLSFNPQTLAFSFNSSSADMWKPMGQAMVAGMGFATVVTLLSVPSLYYLMERCFERKAKRA